MRRIFTFIELLVVVAIIAILAGILLPALNNARKKARDITCIDNLKQMGIILMAYADDNREFLPPVSDKFITMEDPSDYSIFTGSENRWQRGAYSPPNQEKLFGLGLLYKNKYTASIKFMFCGQHQEDLLQANPVWDSSYWKEYNTYTYYRIL